MRLLKLQNEDSFSLVEFVGTDIPPYAILSHTWGSTQDEVTYQDLLNNTGKEKGGYCKLTFCGRQAAKDDLEYFWIDTCCIDKSSSAELAESITSMFCWYQKSAQCYVYLSDVSADKRKADYDGFQFTWESAFRTSRWFSRGWTLQELLAPSVVRFFSREGRQLGNKRNLEQQIHDISNIPILALRGAHLYEFDIEERMLWKEKRQTTRPEDKAYSLLGIFGISMLPNYGEGEQSAFKRLRREIREASGEASLSLSQEQKGMLMDSLRFDQIDARQMTIRNAHAKTCKWLLKSSQYIDWLDETKLNEHHGFLWIKGKPGTGKSTLMKFALINARKTMKDRNIIAFFFNARGGNNEKSTIGTYRSLLLQLLERLPELQGIFNSLSLSTSRISAEHSWNNESLKSLLEQAIISMGESSVVCFIDALDECEEEQIRDMIQFFEHVGELAVSNGIRLQVCFSSRHYPHISIRRGLSLVLEGQEGHTQDIINYLEIELKIGKSKITQQIRSEIQEKASGIFMWVVLVVGILNKEYDKGRIHALRQRLQDIPSDLHHLFRDILTRDSHNRDELVLFIQWVLFAKEPLSPEQLYFAILAGVDPDNAIVKWDPSETTRDVIKRFILNSSKGLAEITTSKLQRVQFIHESVRDFLLKDGFGNIWPDIKGDLQGQSHERLKQCCLNYMTLPPKVPEGLSNTQSQDDFPFLQYAVKNVLYHADAAEGGGITQAQFVHKFPLSRWIKLGNLFQRYEVRRHKKNMTLLYAMAENNMSNLIRLHASISSSLEVGEERYGPPLFAAMATGSREAVEAFIECFVRNRSPENYPHESHYLGWDYACMPNWFGRQFIFSKKRTVLSYLVEVADMRILSIVMDVGKIDVNARDENGATPLSWAVVRGHEAIVRLLLNTGMVNINTTDKSRRTPLLLAAERGYGAIVQLLLDTEKVDVNMEDSSGQTPLSRASREGHGAIVKLLLGIGKVDIDMKDNSRWTPLSWAIREGHEAIVQLLLNTKKVDINARDIIQRTPLLLAVAGGDVAIVQLLLDTGKANVNIKDIDGRTPLLRAAGEGHVAIVQLLLDTDKADINTKDKDGRTALLLALVGGHEAIIRLLLNTRKADVSAKDNDGWTPLSLAVERGHAAIVQLLLDTEKVDVNMKDSGGGTVLSRAIVGRRDAIVQLLLDTGKVDINMKSNYGHTPLSLATGLGREAIVQQLLDNRKVDINMKDNSGRTPLSRAVVGGHKAIVQLLLETGKADINMEENCGDTPLSLAVEKGYEAIVQQLLGTEKIDINMRDRDGRTVLSRAIVGRRDAILQLLLDTGNADLNMKDNYGHTPLSFAIGLELEATMQLLLDTGKVDVNVKDEIGWTPLSLAATRGHKSLVQSLLDTGEVDINAKDKNGRTSLSLAAMRGHTAVVQILLDTREADINTRSDSRETPLSLAVAGGHGAVVKALLDNEKVDINTKDHNGQSPLSLAASRGYEAIVQLLLETGKVDIDIEDRYGRTPLFWATSRGHDAIAKMLQQ